jgi:iron(III) transport system permease protein
VRPQFLAAGILCLWGYLELTPVAILAPPGITSAPVRLYNLMHYGRSYVVSAMTLVAMAVPPLLLLVLALVRKPLLRVR